MPSAAPARPVAEPTEDLLQLLLPDDIKDKASFNTWDVARICGVHKNTIGRWIKEGRLTVINLPNGKARIPRATLQEFLRRYNPTTK